MSRANRPGRSALGRGLDALLPTELLSAEHGEDSARELPLDAIEPNPQQPRKSFSDDDAADLAQSIREHGILQPLLVRRIAPDRYQLVAGERRWRAAREAGLERAPVAVIDAPDRDMLTLALVENLQREDLNPIDQAAAFQYLIDAGLTQAAVAQRVGKSRSAVANAVRLLQLPDQLRELVINSRLGEGHARALLAAPRRDWPQLAEAIVARSLTVREVEEETRRLQEAQSDGGKRAKRDSGATQTGQSAEAAAAAEWRSQAAERLQRAFNTRVSVSRDGPNGGRIVLRWYSAEQLEQLVHQLSTAPPPTDAEGADNSGSITI